MFIGRGGRGGGYGPKKNYKGQRRHFTDADELQQQIERDKKQKDWRVRYIATFCAGMSGELSSLCNSYQILIL